MKKILIYPCGTEIGLEIFRSLRHSAHYEVYGGSCTHDHGRFVYANHIDNLPFLTDSSTAEDISTFNEAVASYAFDFIYPAMDGVLALFAKYREFLSPVVLAPSHETAEITRSKRKTYRVLENLISIPKEYESIGAVKNFPVFIKPDVGQGSKGAHTVNSHEELQKVDFKKNLCLELLTGPEYTIDCFTNSEGKLLYSRGRERKRIRNGISLNTEFVDDEIFKTYAEKINSAIRQLGAWFFQLKKSADGSLKLLEVASRVAGTSALTRCTGVNLALLTVYLFDGFKIDSVITNNYHLELDRALENVFKINFDYNTVYIDYDDTLIDRNNVNLEMIKFIYQCINKKIRVVLLSKHDGNLDYDLRKFRLNGLFDKVIHIGRSEHKYECITEREAIFVDDSFGERKAVKEKCGIPVFAPSMIECLLEV